MYTCHKHTPHTHYTHLHFGHFGHFGYFGYFHRCGCMDVGHNWNDLYIGEDNPNTTRTETRHIT